MIAGCLLGNHSEGQRIMADRTNWLLHFLAVLIIRVFWNKVRKCDFFIGESAKGFLRCSLVTSKSFM
jgi:hypothetical protein